MFSLLILSNASAYLLSYSAWDDNLGSRTIDFGDEAVFFINSFTDNQPLYLDINIYNLDGDTFSHYFSDIANVEEYDRDFTINSDDYINPGNYIINIEIRNDDLNEEPDIFNLALHVLPSQADHEPTIRLVSPEDNAIDVPIDAYLMWIGNDEDNDRLTYDVYLNNNLISEDITESQIQYEFDHDTNYEWHVIVSDGESNAESEHRTFTTRSRMEGENRPPYIPSNPYPSDNSRNIPTEVELKWEGGDPDNDIVRYDVYLNNRIACSNILSNSCFVQSLSQDRNYRWYVEASDHEFITKGPEWRFSTLSSSNENQPPFVNIISPTEKSVVKGNYDIKWNAGDVDGIIANTKIYYSGKGQVDIPIIGDFLDLFRKYELLTDVDSNPEIYSLNTNSLRNGFYGIKIVVRDNNGAESEDSIDEFKVYNPVPMNFAPIINSEPVTKTPVNQIYNYDVDARDPENDVIRYILTDSPEGMTIDSDTGIIEWIPKKIGVYNVAVKAQDIFNHYNTQEFIIQVLSSDDSIIPEEILRNIHRFGISNLILDNDGKNINVYVNINNEGNQKEKIQLKAINMITGDIISDSFTLNNQEGYWRILRLPKPLESGVYNIGVFANSKDYKDFTYRTIFV